MYLSSFHSSCYNKILDKLFKNKNKSKINFVRLASHFSEINEVIKICKIIKSKGYFVAINLIYLQNKVKKYFCFKKINKAKPDLFILQIVSFLWTQKT